MKNGSFSKRMPRYPGSKKPGARTARAAPRTAVAEAVASDLGLVTDVLDPIEGITADARGNDYLTVMAANLEALRKANSCS